MSIIFGWFGLWCLFPLYCGGQFY